MFDPITLAVGGALVAAGWVAGRVTRARKGTPTPMCSCDHGLAFHDPETRTCHGKTRQRTESTDKWVDCTCRQYDGPVPVEELFTRPTLPPKA